MSPILPASRAAGSHLFVAAWVGADGLRLIPLVPTPAGKVLSELLEGATDEQQEVILAGTFLLVRPAALATRLVQALWARAQELGLDRQAFAAAVSCTIQNSYAYLDGRKRITFDLALAWVARWNREMGEELFIEGTPDAYLLNDKGDE